MVPEDSDVGLGNDAADIEAAIIYADLSDSTKLVDNYKDDYAAEQYKTFLKCSSKIIRAEGGHIRSFDGDRVMGIFIGDSKNTSAARAALKINYAVKHIIEPARKNQYPNSNYVMKHVVGVDQSKVMAIRAGIRGANDLAWIGRAPNYAAKLTAMDDAFSTWISGRVYDSLDDSLKYSSGKNMWEERSWTAMNNVRIYRSNYWWSF
ncbi:adenylate/guanylate cyclase domain-containing protein [Rhizobium ruizarguesonis]|uniref:adenylate/guanylate cyclase domain-containing protein n=1 Tax=Rhizobium ruizarguesonis TaxID=2081791 RepID=UPI0018D58F9A|nr:adenylate/guanylate cyclase domain-containing protein [Rhizobium ruizarguesonis]